MTKTTINGIGEVVQSLKVIYPQSMPKTDQEMKILIAAWFADLGHIPFEILKDAAQYLRRHEDWPTIAAMWRSVQAVAGILSAYEVKEAIDHGVSEGQQLRSIKTSEFHPIVAQVWNALGGYAGISGMPQGVFESAFIREYEQAARAYYEYISRPENVHLLEAQYSTGTERIAMVDMERRLALGNGRSVRETGEAVEV